MNRIKISLVLPLGWIPDGGRQNMYWKLLSLLLLFGSTHSNAQPIKCTNVNASIDEFGNIFVSVFAFVYEDCIDSVKYTVYNPFGGVVQTSDAADCADIISFNACSVHDQTYKVRFGEVSDSCWADLTFSRQNDSLCTGDSLFCTEVNAGIDADGRINVLVGEFVTNCTDSFKYTVYNPYGGVVQTSDAVGCADAISFHACSVLGQTYKVYFESASDSCWGNLTFHEATGRNCVIRWPSCTNVNAELDTDGNISALVGQFVTNCRDSIDYTVFDQEGEVVLNRDAADCGDAISFNACAAVVQTYKVHFSNGSRSCWSDLTFDKVLDGPCLVEGPDCRDVDAELDADGNIRVLVGEFVSNCSGSIDYAVYNQGGEVVETDDAADCTDVISFNACFSCRSNV